MKNRVFKARVSFGKINYTGSGNRYPAEIEMELRECGGDPVFQIVNGERVYTGETTPRYIEFSACGTVWNTRHTDCYMGGQCIDDMGRYIKSPKFRKIAKWWKQYHLNGMNAGTPEQTAAIKAWEAAGNRYDYTAACEMLKSRDLYSIPFWGRTTGKEWSGELYCYGHGWIINDIPAADLQSIADFIAAERAEAIPEWLQQAITESETAEARKPAGILGAAAEVIEAAADLITAAPAPALVTA